MRDPVEAILAVECPVGHCWAEIGDACEDYKKPRHEVDVNGIGYLGPWVPYALFHAERIRDALSAGRGGGDSLAPDGAAVLMQVATELQQWDRHGQLPWKTLENIAAAVGVPVRTAGAPAEASQETPPDPER